MFRMTTNNILKFKKVRDVKTPIFSSKGAAGMDVFIPNDFPEQYLQIDPFGHIKVPSGIKFDIPKGYCLLAVNKSGIALKQRLVVGACLIDNDYTGEFNIHLINTSCHKVFLKPGQKAMQLLFQKYYQPILQEVKEINKNTERANGAFGSTGLF